MNANVWEPHAPSRAGDDVPVIANFFSPLAAIPLLCMKIVSATAPKPAREAAPCKVSLCHVA
jgi:hypothetical protein